MKKTKYLSALLCMLMLTSCGTSKDIQEIPTEEVKISTATTTEASVTDATSEATSTDTQMLYNEVKYDGDFIADWESYLDDMDTIVIRESQTNETASDTDADNKIEYYYAWDIKNNVFRIHTDKIEQASRWVDEDKKEEKTTEKNTEEKTTESTTETKDDEKDDKKDDETAELHLTLDEKGEKWVEITDGKAVKLEYKDVIEEIYGDIIQVSDSTTLTQIDNVYYFSDVKDLSVNDLIGVKYSELGTKEITYICTKVNDKYIPDSIVYEKNFTYKGIEYKVQTLYHFVYNGNVIMPKKDEDYLGDF